jgi:FkbM family methyltransferase
VLVSGVAVIDAEVEGIRFRLHMKDNVSERKFLFMPQFFDAFERGLMRERLKDGGVFADIGANAGIYSMTAAALVGDGGTVLAVEPNPAVMKRLALNAALNGFTGRIRMAGVGVSDAAGSFDLVLDESNLGGSSLVAARSGKSIRVPCLPLLDLLRQEGISRLDGLKIDIEGAEDKALAPFFRAAPRDLHPGFIILENSEGQWAEDLPGILRAAGYRLLRRTRMNLVWEREL